MGISDPRLLLYHHVVPDNKTHFSLLPLYIYIYIYIYVCVCVCTYIAVWPLVTTHNRSSSSSSSSSLSSSSVTSWALIDLFRPLLIISSKVFQVLFVRLVYNSTLFLASCCCSFLLHVVANFWFVSSKFLVDWFYFQLLQNFLLYFRLFFWKIPSRFMSVFSLRIQILLPNRRMGENQCVI
jgi:hypothetical protein